MLRLASVGRAGSAAVGGAKAVQAGVAGAAAAAGSSVTAAVVAGAISRAAHAQAAMASVSRIDSFARRHHGEMDSQEVADMLATVGVATVDDLMSETVPAHIRLKRELDIEPAMTEMESLAWMKEVSAKNKVYRSYIGMGYYNTVTPPVILRNIIENPLWYTPYTPYQAEVSQGRLESLLNFQTMVSDLTALDIAGASLLDEGTAAGEAMALAYGVARKKANGFFVDQNVHPQTIDCVRTRAEPIGVQVHVGDWRTFEMEGKDIMGALIQYPDTNGEVSDYEAFVAKAKDQGATVACATDLLALTVLKPPGEFGCDIALGNSQRFGVPLGYGGPHAAFFATRDGMKRKLPGRIIGVSKDAQGKTAFRMALQTREQHIRRQTATSNICTAQALLANVAAMYGVYHGPDGLREIGARTHNTARVLAAGLEALGHTLVNERYFDTVRVTVRGGADGAASVMGEAEKAGINLRRISDTDIGISVDEATTVPQLEALIDVFERADPSLGSHTGNDLVGTEIAAGLEEGNAFGGLERTSEFMTHAAFNSYHTEHEMLRYIYRLVSKDVSLCHSMIPLGSCTMKLNATSEMIPLTMEGFSNIHPFVPADQAAGYAQLINKLRDDLKTITGFDEISFQPNSGAQGEYAGLYAIRNYLRDQGQGHRNVCLIPKSAHGTNPATAVMAGMKVVEVAVLPDGGTDVADLDAKIAKHGDNLAALMITYPSTFGVFEEAIVDICDKVHAAGGQVYMDGANMNAQVGFCAPGDFGADVCHLNLHKTFCIPHGGGGPGMGPIGVAAHLAPYLASHVVVPCNNHAEAGSAISAAPFGSASILTISAAYINMMGPDGLADATRLAILRANYCMTRLADHYPVLYRGTKGRCAHEFIIDCNGFKETTGIEVGDIAKRLMDFGFHAPTMSFPVAGTLMIEPTESESKEELDRLCDALIAIRQEIRDIEEGRSDRDDNALRHAPHTAEVVTSDSWDRSYSREQAAYPAAWLHRFKYWPTVSRIDDVHGDKNLFCECPPVDAYTSHDN